MTENDGLLKICTSFFMITVTYNEFIVMITKCVELFGPYWTLYVLTML